MIPEVEQRCRARGGHGKVMHFDKYGVNRCSGCGAPFTMDEIRAALEGGAVIERSSRPSWRQFWPQDKAWDRAVWSHRMLVRATWTLGLGSLIVLILRAIRMLGRMGVFNG